MSRATLVEPDLEFIKELKSIRGDPLKKCYQCATCSVVCNLSSEDRPFPRKEMLWAQWGLKERLINDPDLWLCHQCNDCSKYCPRGAKPGDVLASLRQMVILQNAFPLFLAKWGNDPRFLPLLLAIPATILSLFTWRIGTLQIPEGPIVYSKFIGYWVIGIVFLPTVLWAVLNSLIGVSRLWKGFKKFNPPDPGSKSSLAAIRKGIAPIIAEILKHTQFRNCETNKARYYAHLSILWGFILLTITTISVAVGVYLFGKETPWPLIHPVKWIGNIGGLILIFGAILAITNRLTKEGDSGKATYFDWLFLLVVLFTGISGFLAEILRLVNTPSLAYPIYFIHLVLVWFLFAFLPFSKFTHFLYRTAAILYSRSANRGRPKESGTTCGS